ARVFSEVLKAHRAIEVEDMDEFTEVLAVCQSERWPRGRRLSVVTASGGQAELMLDVASEHGFDLPPLPPAQRKEAERVIGAITGDGNPLDAWGNGDYATNFPHALKVLDQTPSADVIVFSGDSCDGQPMGRAERTLAYTNILLAAAQASSKPHYVMNTRPGLMLREQVDLLRKHGIAMIGGSRQGLGAIDKLARWFEAPPARRAAAVSGPGLAKYLQGGARRTINEFDAKRLLAGHGIPVAKETLVASSTQAVEAARAIGFPVVLKAVSDDIPHKSEHGLV